MSNNNYPFIVLNEPIVLDRIDVNVTKGENVSTNETPQKPTVSLGDLDIEININKPSERYIITKTYKGDKLFYKKHRNACTSYLSKGTHFDTLKEAQDHFESYIKIHWKHTKKFQIEPVSNFFISNWTLVTDDNYYNQVDLTGKRKVVLKNIPISIDEYKKGKPLNTVKELLQKFIADAEKRKLADQKSIENWQMSIKQTSGQLIDRDKKLETLVNNATLIENLIEENTTEAERTVKLFYGKE